MDSSAWDERYSASDAVWPHGPNRWVEQLVGPMEPGSALDIAAGEGRHAVWLVERGWTVRATDFSPVAITRLRQRAEALTAEQQRALRWDVADATGWLMRSERDAYDLVLLAYLHLPPVGWAKALRGAVARTRPGGHTLVVGHAGMNLSVGVGGPAQRDLLYDPSEVLAIVDDLPVRAVVADIWKRDVPGEIRSALDTVALLQRLPPKGSAGRRWGRR
ncbi:MAG: class I SAM-dependent methyltransferase [Ornithinimicrobium sp.]